MTDTITKEEHELAMEKLRRQYQDDYIREMERFKRECRDGNRYSNKYSDPNAYQNYNEYTRGMKEEEWDRVSGIQKRSPIAPFPWPADKLSAWITLPKLDPVPCRFCKLDVYRVANISLSIFELENLGPNSKISSYKVLCDSKCFDDQIGSNFIHDDVYPYITKENSCSCFQCSAPFNIDVYNTIVDTYFRIVKYRIMNRDEHFRKEVGSIRFCEPCWISLAGSNFFDSLK